MATHSSVLAWRIPGTRDPHGLPPMGSHRVGHDWSDLAAAAAEVRNEKREIQIAPVTLFEPGSSWALKLGSFPQASWVHKSIAFWLFNFFIDQDGNQPQEEVQIEVGRGRRRRGRQRMRWLDSITDSMNMNVSKLWEMVKVREAWHAAVHGVVKSQIQLRD